MGQRGSKAAGSLITNAFANSMADLNLYGNAIGTIINLGLLFVSNYMGKCVVVMFSLYFFNFVDNLNTTLPAAKRLVRNRLMLLRL